MAPFVLGAIHGKMRKHPGAFRRIPSIGQQNPPISKKTAPILAIVLPSVLESKVR